MAKSPIKTYTLANMKDTYIGKRGTKAREQYEYELSMELVSQMIKKVRQDRNLTQAQLGQLIGVQKAQISKLESSANSATLDTVVKVFKALKANIQFTVTVDEQLFRLTQ